MSTDNHVLKNSLNALRRFVKLVQYSLVSYYSENSPEEKPDRILFPVKGRGPIQKEAPVGPCWQGLARNLPFLPGE